MYLRPRWSYEQADPQRRGFQAPGCDCLQAGPRRCPQAKVLGRTVWEEAWDHSGGRLQDFERKDDPKSPGAAEGAALLGSAVELRRFGRQVCQGKEGRSPANKNRIL